MSWLSAIGGALDTVSNFFGRKSDIANQKKFAQKSIQWRVEDAKKAGIHPVFALGANVPTYTPVSQVGSTSFGQMGQDISRAIHATSSGAQRDTTYANMARDLSLEKMGLENELLASQIRMINQPGTPPALAGAVGSEGRSPLGVMHSIVSGSPIPTGPGSPAERMENEYGEFVGDIYGAVRYLADGLRRLNRPVTAPSSTYGGRGMSIIRR